LRNNIIHHLCIWMGSISFGNLQNLWVKRQICHLTDGFADW
jgi:hypothetical protein